MSRRIQLEQPQAEWKKWWASTARSAKTLGLRCIIPALLIAAVLPLVGRVGIAADVAGLSPVLAADAPAGEPLGLRQFSLGEFDAGRLAWIMLGTCAALMLVGPGLACIAAGRGGAQKRAVDALLEYLFVASVLSLCWVLWIYSFSFSRYEKSHDITRSEIQGSGIDYSPGNRFIGGAKHVALKGLDSALENTKVTYPIRRPNDAIPHLLFMVFQLGIFVATAPPLAVLLSQRFGWGGAGVYLAGWGTLVYAPIAYWIWGGGWHAAALDFGGGFVIHVSGGFSALALSFCIRPTGEPSAVTSEPDTALLGAGTLLFWAGSLLANSSQTFAPHAGSVSAFVVTQLAAAAGVIGWCGCEWLSKGRADKSGACAGAIAGLCAAAAGSGYVAPQSAMIIGLFAGAVCFAISRKCKSFDSNPMTALFTLQGCGGALGVLLTGIFATASVSGHNRKGSEVRGLLSGNFDQLLIQCTALAAVAIWALFGTYLTAKLMQLVLRRLEKPQATAP